MFTNLKKPDKKLVGLGSGDQTQHLASDSQILPKVTNSFTVGHFDDGILLAVH
jgi:hypothetical protein